MYFTYRKKRYKVEKDAYNLILYKQTSNDHWNIEGYYSDPNTLIKKLIKEHLFDEKEGKLLLSQFNTLQSELLMAFKANLKGVGEEI